MTIVDAYQTGFRHGRDGIRYFIPEGATNTYAKRYAEGYAKGKSESPLSLQAQK